MIKKRYIIFALFLVVICVMICAGKVYAYSDANNIQCAVLEDAKIDRRLPEMVKSVILGLQIAVPIILVIYGTIDFIKGISSQKEDEISELSILKLDNKD